MKVRMAYGIDRSEKKLRASLSQLAFEPLPILSVGLVSRDQLGHKTHEYGHADAQNGFNQTMQGIEPRMVAIIEQNDGADIPGHLSGILQTQEVAEKHGNQNTETNRP